MTKKVKVALRKELKGIKKPTNKTWKSYLVMHSLKPDVIFSPKNTAEVCRIVEFAKKNKLKVQTVGSGHSFSNINSGESILIEPYAIQHFKVDKKKYSSYLKKIKAESCVTVGGGITVREINNIMDKQRPSLGMINQGTYEGQTIMGAVSTSTHGSGAVVKGKVNIPAFPDLVISLKMVCSMKTGVKVVRIEKSGGPSNKKNFKEAGVDHLIQDNTTFKAAICNMGTFGVITELTLIARNNYFLREEGELVSWSKIKKEIKKHGVKNFLSTWKSFSKDKNKKRIRHKELVVAPYRAPKKATLAIKCNVDFEKHDLDGDYPVSIVNRCESQKVKSGKLPILLMQAEQAFHSPKRAASRAFLGFLGGPTAINALFAVMGPYHNKKTTNNTYMYQDKYYKVLPRGGKKAGGYGIEVFAPIEMMVEVMDQIHIEIEKITKASLKGRLKMTDIEDKPKKSTRNNGIYFGPIGVRFIAKSEALLSPMYGKDMVSFEALMIRSDTMKRFKEDQKKVAELEKRLLNKFGSRIRVHWGLEMDVIGKKYLQKHFSSTYRVWNKNYMSLNVGGVFNNKFTKKLGLSK